MSSDTSTLPLVDLFDDNISLIQLEYNLKTLRLNIELSKQIEYQDFQFSGPPSASFVDGRLTHSTTG